MNKNNRVRLTESQLHNVIKESVKRVLNEGQSTSEDLENAISILSELTTSGYIPFSSPSPSSTEFAIKKSITDALNLLNKAYYLHRQCYGD